MIVVVLDITVSAYGVHLMLQDIVGSFIAFFCAYHVCLDHYSVVRWIFVALKLWMCRQDVVTEVAY